MNKFNFLDVGAKFGPQYAFPWPIHSRFNELKVLFNFYGIEPDPIHFRYLSLNKNINHLYEIGLNDVSGESILYETKGTGKSSILKPIKEEIEKHYNGDIDEYSVIREHKIYLHTIDDFFKSVNFDIIKIDTQGSEYNILVGGKNHLPKCTSLWIETSTVEQYEGQKTHDEIVEFLDSEGFFPIRELVHGELPIEKDVIFMNKNIQNKELNSLITSWFKV